MVSNVGDFGFFSCNNCAEWEGDCDSHSECQYDLVCGLNNCLASLGFNSDVNCCYNATLVDENFCRSDNPCNENEGNGDSAAECQNGLICGSNNCPVSLGFDNEIDCCETTNCNSATSHCNGDTSFCSSNYPCGEDEGDCDSDGECNAGLICGQNNCPYQLGFATSVDCCIPQSSRKNRYFHPSRNVTSPRPFIDKERKAVPVTDFASPFIKNSMPEN